MLGAGAPIVGWGVGEQGFRLIFEDAHFRPGDPVAESVFFLASSAIVMGSWWIVLSGIVAVAIRPVRWLLTPFANRMRRVHVLWLTALGVIAAGAGAATLLFA
jgi:hypothetical protein